MRHVANGLIVDYCGILKNLRKALAIFAGHTGAVPQGENEEATVDPLNPQEKLLEELAEVMTIVSEQLRDDGFDLVSLHRAEGFDKFKALRDAKEIINTNDETRKRFEIAARAVFRKYKACLTFTDVENYKTSYQAISYIYKSLQDDKQKADTSAIMQKLNQIVSEVIDVTADNSDNRVFDISKINFDALRAEFVKSQRKASDVQDMRSVLEERLAQMLAMNLTLLNFQERFDEIVSDYNQEKDKNTIEATFEALMLLTADMEQAEQSHVALGLTAEQKPVFDLLTQENLTKAEIKQIKKASVELLRAIEERTHTVQGLFQKEVTRDGLRITIYDLLFDEQTGLPVEKFDVQTLEVKTEAVFSYFETRFAMVA